MTETEISLINKVVRPAFTKESLAAKVEKLVRTDHLTYVEAIIHICDDTGIDPADIAKLVTGALKDKVAVEAMDRNIIPKTTTELY
jgi:hypothetical protein